MTIGTTTNQIPYTGDGVSVAFAFNYPFIVAADLKINIGGVLQTTGYTVSGTLDVTGTGAFASGTVTFALPPAIGAAIYLYSDPDLLQSSSLLPNDPLPAKTVEKMVDKVTLQIQRTRQSISQSISAPVGETLSVLPSAAARANALLGFDASGNPIATGFTVSQVAAAIVASYATSVPLIASFSVKSFPGVVGDGTNDDTLGQNTAIAAANVIAAANRFYGNVTIWWPNGTYKTTSPLVLTKSGVSVRAESPGGTILYNPNSSTDMFVWDGSALAIYNSGIYNFRISTPGNSTAGAHIRATRCINFHIDNVICDSWYSGIVLDGCAVTSFTKVWLTQDQRTPSVAVKPFEYGFDLQGTNFSCSDIHMTDVQVRYNPTNFPNITYTGSVRAIDGLYAKGVHMWGTLLYQPAINAAFPSGQTCASTQWVDCYWDAGNTGNIALTGTSPAYRDHKFAISKLRASGGNGILFSAVSQISRVQLVGNDYDGHRLFAIADTGSLGVIDLEVNGGIFNNNNTDNAASTGDIYIGGRATIIGTRHQGGGAAGNAIILNGSSTKCLVSGAVLSDASMAATARIVDSGTGNKIRGCNGFVTKSRGQVTITNPATSITVTHGLSMTPLAGMIMTEFSGASDAAGVTRKRVANFTATTFDILLNATPTTTAQIDWNADGEF